MNVSVIICSFNRAPILCDTLASFLRVQLPIAGRTELIVVDNNSHDGTPHVVERFRQRAPELIRFLTEKTPGLSSARNTGIRASESDIIAFADDDVYFHSLWLIEMVKVFEDFPEVMCVGGRSVPLFEGGTPDWISQRLLKIYGSTNSGDAIKRMQYPEHPFGLNMAFRREVFSRVGLFDTNLGRKKKALLSNEETALFYRIDRAGLPVFYTPHAVLQHRISPSRAKKKWVLQRYYWQGISDVVFRQSTQRTGRLQLARQAKWQISTLLNDLLSMRFSQSDPQQLDASATLMRWIKCSYRCGEIRQTLLEALGMGIRNLR